MKKLIPILVLGLLLSGNAYAECVQGNCVNGQGTQTFPNGDKYVGEFKDNKFHGQGTQTFLNGATYVGEFKKGKPDGQGTITGANGNKYVGKWKDGKKHGQGTEILANGDKYEGEWKDDKQNGQGIYTRAEDEKNLAIMVRDAKKTCRVLGFKDSEPKFNDCTLKIYTQKNDDLIQQRKAQSQNQSRKAQSQNQSTSQPGTNTNTIIMQGSGGSDNSQEMMDRGLDMLSGRRGVDGSIRSAPSAPIINRQVCTSIVISRNPYMTKEVCR